MILSAILANVQKYSLHLLKLLSSHKQFKTNTSAQLMSLCEELLEDHFTLHPNIRHIEYSTRSPLATTPLQDQKQQTGTIARQKDPIILICLNFFGDYESVEFFYQNEQINLNDGICITKLNLHNMEYLVFLFIFNTLKIIFLCPFSPF